MKRKLISLCLAGSLMVGLIPNASYATELPDTQATEITTEIATMEEVTEDVTSVEDEVTTEVAPEIITVADESENSDEITAEDTIEVSDETAKLSEEETEELLATGDIVDITDTATFPDVNFRKYLKNTFDKDNDNKISVADVKSLQISNYNKTDAEKITDVKGMECFTKVSSIQFSYFDFTEDIDLNFYSQLSYIDFSECNLTNCNLKNSVNKMNVYFWKSTFSNFNIVNCPNINGLTYQNCGVTTVSTENYLNLSYLHIENCNLSSIDISKNINLTGLIIGKSNLSSLDISHNPKLRYLQCCYNNLSELNLANNPELERVYCYGNKITNLDITKNSKLITVAADETVGIDITNRPDIQLELQLSNMTGKIDLSKINGIDKLIDFPGYDRKTKMLTYIPTRAEYGDVSNDYDDENTYYYYARLKGTGRLQLMSKTKSDSLADESYSVRYNTHVQTYGWQGDTSNLYTWKKDGELSGKTGESKRLEAIQLIASGGACKLSYTTHCQTYGWLPWSTNGEINGTSGEGKRLEAIKIIAGNATGTGLSEVDVYYRVHAQSYGWLGWAKNGQAAGTAGLSKRLEAIQVVLVPKGGQAPGNTYQGVTSNRTEPYISKDGSKDADVKYDEYVPNVKYRTHVQTYGWQGYKYNGAMSGTSGKAKRLEGINIELTNNAPWHTFSTTNGIIYTTHVQSYGWQGDLNDKSTWKKNGEMSGTSGQAKRLEAICIDLTGDISHNYDIYYRVHSQTYGWLAWAKNGEPSGTAGKAKRLEGIQIVLVKKGEAAPPNTYQGVTSTNAKAYIQ